MCDFKSKSHRFIFYGSFVYHVLDVMTFVLHRSRPKLYGNSLIWCEYFNLIGWLVISYNLFKNIKLLKQTGLSSMIHLYTLLLLWWSLDDINTTLGIGDYSSLSLIWFLYTYNNYCYYHGNGKQRTNHSSRN